jgi:hypothetical protein
MSETTETGVESSSIVSHHVEEEPAKTWLSTPASDIQERPTFPVLAFASATGGSYDVHTYSVLSKQVWRP